MKKETHYFSLDKITQLMSMLNCSPQTAENCLMDNGWEVERSITAFFDKQA